MAILLGLGRLSWPARERRSDRYGFVGLFDGATLIEKAYGPDWNDKAVSLDAAIPLAGQRGFLCALVLETRESRHIGDLFRGIRPSTPKVGDVIVLGKGTLVYDANDGPGEAGFPTIGLSPDDARVSDWLDPKQLYKVIDQTVELAFVPDDGNPFDVGGHQ